MCREFEATKYSQLSEELKKDHLVNQKALYMVISELADLTESRIDVLTASYSMIANAIVDQMNLQEIDKLIAEHDQAREEAAKLDQSYKVFDDDLETTNWN